MITQAPRGVEDWYGERMHRRAYVEGIARELARTYGMTEIITPMFEHTVLFQRGVGETTDVVQKEMYTFTDKGDRSITLKPEGTAGVMRAYLEHNLYANPAPAKLYYVSQAFRYEKPQSGRLRQHHQFGVEFVGAKSPLAEVELISLVTALIGKLGLKDAKLHINSIGCPHCKKDYNDALLSYLRKHEEHLCDTCRERMQKNPLRVIDCKNPECKEIVKDAPRTVEYLDAECREHFEELKSLLTELSIPFEVDTGIVRGLDYYTGTVYETFMVEHPEIGSICSGGRYDNLAEYYTDKILPGVGISIGLTRLFFILNEQGLLNGERNTAPADVLLLPMVEDLSPAVELATRFRNAGVRVQLYGEQKKFPAVYRFAFLSVGP